MERKRVTLSVAVDMDPVPGTFHTVDSVVEQVQAILEQAIPHYVPSVYAARVEE